MLILDTDPYSLQATLSMVTDYANKEHYVLHPTKSVVIPFNFKSKTELNHLKENIKIEINGKELPIVEELVHLGLTHNRNSSVLPTIENRISTANRTLYALMGPGLHGTNGLPPEISLHLYNVYVIPRALYGLEVLTLTDTILKSMELFHRKSPCSLLGLPGRTATAGLYILTGSLPIKFYVHTSTLGFLWTLLNTEITREIILRQYATKRSSSASWVVYISKLLSKYNLPSIIDIYIDFPDKEQWRKSIQKAIYDHATEEVHEEAKTKSTLTLLNTVCQPKQTHSAISFITNPFQVNRMNIKIRLLLDDYPLGKNKRRMKQITSDICDFCLEEREDRPHFLLKCKAFKGIRTKFFPMMMDMFPTETQTLLKTDEQIFKQILLDHSHHTAVPHDNGFQHKWENITRNYIFAIHQERTMLLVKEVNPPPLR